MFFISQQRVERHSRRAGASTDSKLGDVLCCPKLRRLELPRQSAAQSTFKLIQLNFLWQNRFIININNKCNIMSSRSINKPKWQMGNDFSQTTTTTTSATRKSKPTTIVIVMATAAASLLPLDNNNNAMGTRLSFSFEKCEFVATNVA